MRGDGYPFLHPQLPLALLYEATLTYLAKLKRTSRRPGEEIVLLEAALGLSFDMETLPSFILTEAIKCPTPTRAGDVSRSGAFFIRSTQDYTYERSSRVSERTSNAINSFVFVRLDGDAAEIDLVRVLGLLLLEGADGTPQYCCCVVMKLVSKGYLPFDRYRYRSIRHASAGGRRATCSRHPPLSHSEYCGSSLLHLLKASPSNAKVSTT